MFTAARPICYKTHADSGTAALHLEERLRVALQRSFNPGHRSRAHPRKPRFAQNLPRRRTRCSSGTRGDSATHPITRPCSLRELTSVRPHSLWSRCTTRHQSLQSYWSRAAQARHQRCNSVQHCLQPGSSCNSGMRPGTRRPSNVQQQTNTRDVLCSEILLTGAKSTP